MWQGLDVAHYHLRWEIHKMLAFEESEEDYGGQTNQLICVRQYLQA